MSPEEFHNDPILFPLTELLFLLNIFCCVQLLKAPKDEHVSKMLKQVAPGKTNQGYLKDLVSHLGTSVNKTGHVSNAFLNLVPCSITFDEFFGDLSHYDQCVIASLTLN